MPEIPAGLDMDRPPLSNNPYWRAGYNIRVRLGRMETIGLFKPMRSSAGALLQLPGLDTYRSAYIAPGILIGEILFGSVSRVMAAIYDSASTIASGTTYTLKDITPAGLPAASDGVPRPSSGATTIVPT
jgi:hypothetical protein